MRRVMKALLAASGLATLLPVMVAGPAEAAGEVSPNGQIAFASYEWCCAYDIYVVNPDGTGLTNVTNTPDVSETGPSWSPDGTRIAYTRSDQGEGTYDYDIWVMNADGSAQTALTDNTDDEYMGNWAPDGTRLVYSRYTEGRSITSQSDVFVMNADGSGQTNITNADTDETNPSWSPDGDRIVFAAVRPSPGEDWYRWEIATIDPDGTNEAQITTANDIDGNSYEDHYPSWDPTGEMIVWMSQYDESCCGDWDVWAMNEDGSGKTNLTDDGDAWSGPADWFPTWSPDGTEIVFSSYQDGTGTEGLYAMPAPTSLPAGGAARLSGAAATTDGSATGATASLATGARKLADGAVSGTSWAPEATATATLTVARRGTGGGRVTSVDGLVNCGRDCTEAYAAGSTVKLRARPAAGSTFAGWGGACTGTATTCTVRLDQAASVRASFRTTA